MTVVAVLADVPEESGALAALTEETPLSESAATELYRAGLRDVVRSVAASGGDLLVNYRPRGDPDATEERIREVVAPALEGVDRADPRYEVQVGETPSGRAGNTVTHLLEEESVKSAAVVHPTAPLLGRTHVDEAAMKLRNSEVVLGPAVGGAVYYAGFTAPVDFETAFAPATVETLTDRARTADHDADFLATVPKIDTPAGLASTVALVRAKGAADRAVPGFTAEVFDRLGLSVTGEGSAVGVSRE